VDIVLNSLTGASQRAGLGLLAPGGRFVEIGKTDIWTADRMAAERPDVRYFPFYLGDLDDGLIRGMLDSLLAAFVSGELKPLPLRTFALTDAVAAFRHMAQARHIGKIVLATGGVKRLRIRSDASYVVTGGLSGLGLAVAEWLAERGARRLVLAGRSGAERASAAAGVARLQAAGVDVVVVAADVSREEDVARIFESAGAGLRGIIHAAAAGPFEDLRREIKAARVEDVRDSHVREEGPLLGASGRREYLRACALRELHGGEADAAGCRVNEHALAALHAGEPVQAVLRRQERNGNRRRVFAADRGRLSRHASGGGCHVRAEASAGHADHVIADGEVLDACADGRHDADALGPEGAGFAGVHPERVEHVAEVEADVRHRYFDFSRTGRAPRRWRQVQIGAHAARGELERHGAGVSAIAAGRGHEPPDETAAAADGDQRLASRQRHSLPEAMRLVFARLSLQVDAGARELRMLRRHRSGERPGRGLDRIR
jgi:hypothetical protein